MVRPCGARARIHVARAWRAAGVGCASKDAGARRMGRGSQLLGAPSGRAAEAISEHAASRQEGTPHVEPEAGSLRAASQGQQPDRRCATSRSRSSGCGNTSCAASTSSRCSMPKASLWLDMEDSPDAAYTQNQFERVTEVTAYVYSERDEMFTRARRYFPARGGRHAQGHLPLALTSSRGPHPDAGARAPGHLDPPRQGARHGLTASPAPGPGRAAACGGPRARRFRPAGRGGMLRGRAVRAEPPQQNASSPRDSAPIHPRDGSRRADWISPRCPGGASRRNRGPLWRPHPWPESTPASSRFLWRKGGKGLHGRLPRDRVGSLQRRR